MSMDMDMNIFSNIDIDSTKMNKKNDFTPIQTEDNHTNTEHEMNRSRTPSTPPLFSIDRNGELHSPPRAPLKINRNIKLHYYIDDNESVSKYNHTNQIMKGKEKVE